MIDTHAHIYAEEFDEDLEQVVERATAIGVDRILLPNIDLTSIERTKAVAARFAACLPMMGLHPCYVKDDYKVQLEAIRQELDRGGYIAVGEIGTDLYWDKTHWNEQKEAFQIQCAWAVERKLPVAIHCRESIDETIDLVRPYYEQGLSGVFHCFSGNLEQAKTIQGMGFYLGIGGVATFKNGGLDAVLPFINKDLVLLETDSPYLAPAPYRGKRNEPSYTVLVASKVADFWHMEVKEVDSITTANATRLFKL